MDNYLIDRETLGQFIDELIKNKSLELNTVEELENFREEQIKSLDDRIGLAIFKQLSREQNDEFNAILDRDEQDPEVFEKFFDQAGIDVEKTISDTMEDFGKEFLGGKNA